MGAPCHYYIWYRVGGDAAAARAAVDAVLHDVFEHAGVAGRALVRRDDPGTWMEVYEHVADGALFERALAAAVARHGLAQHAEGGVRHVEPFVAPA
ncbi:MAG: DUF4936 family protein [Betaproteobacteria bacterium]|jgi:hypothetical protein|nr:DUF4936 family protein [Betaproteobacteria bacterium]MCC7215874.1 DUF4936 family protein [Burkholderiales bacterium]